MKIIDILNKMANRTLEDGFKFCFKNEVYTYKKEDDSIRDIHFCRIGQRKVLENHLNEEVLLFKESDVEIIEENKEIKELDDLELINARPEVNARKINELVRAVNKINKQLEEQETEDIDTVERELNKMF